jgi:hypothetical protein
MTYQDDDYHPTSTAMEYHEGDELGSLDDNSTERRLYNEQFGPDDAHSETITVNSQKNKYRRMWDDAKRADKGFHKIKRKVGHKKVEMEVYSSSTTPGRMIRDAITGVKYSQYRVGSVNEHLFFKVGLATGELGNNGGALFFDSPEQYERHMKTTVSPEIKQKWVQKCAEIRQIEETDHLSDYVIVK